MVLTTAGDIVYDVYLYRFQVEPFPSLADVLYLGSYVALIGALAVLVHRRAPGRNRETWIDTAVMTLAAACVVATVVIMPLLTESAAPTLTTVISVAYPLLDVIALSVLIRLLVDVERMNPALALMGVSLACMLTADLVFQSLAAQGLGGGGAGLGRRALPGVHLAAGRSRDRPRRDQHHQTKSGHSPNQGPTRRPCDRAL